ncbi:DUF4197 domain-containing protein [Adhaeribacter rhizoryzae]|uniref:DUF4197 domain-containing protein n=1 Tax=Adhaeribacter rhizoryzae TaxID=2607907 RepID=A0A5M6DDB1_9BACT|nr:DUF4197 domain-containing protein [Adhaeribacter rhizoryzae]KAA5544059.1 DUF4197 domain-containing protein [Adhaeribacter rhizoryzae]
MKQIIILMVLAFTGTGAVAQIDLKKIKQAVTQSTLSNQEVSAGLKEALTKGATKGSELVSQVDGYYKNPEIKIPFPAEVRNVETKLRQIGMGAEVDKFVLALNRAAEDAAQEAKPVFVSAIKQMTIQDAFAILKGQPDAATQYLQRTTSDELTQKFKPIIQNSLAKVNATQYYATLINTYNKIPLVKKVNPNLDDYATAKALDGLFLMVAKEEKNIRQNPQARTSEILKKVFSSQS